MKIQYMHHMSGNKCRFFLILDFFGGRGGCFVFILASLVEASGHMVPKQRESL